MKKLNLLALGIIAFLAAGTTVAADTVGTQQGDIIVSPNDTYGASNGFDPRYLHKTSMACGVTPIPPIGCKVGACSCDQNGSNCQWTFICK